MPKGKNLAGKEKKIRIMIIKQKQAKTRSDLVKVVKMYILHGWTYNLSKWNPFLSLLRSKGLNPYLLPIPGLTDKINKPWNIDNYVDWLLGKIGKEKKIILIGHSNGGRIALNFSIKYPEKVAKLILIDSAGIYHDDIFIRLKREGFSLLAKIGKKIIPLDGARKLLYFLSREKDYRTANPIMKKTMINLIQSDKTLNLSKITTPTTIIWGKNDSITPIFDGKLMNQQINNSKLYIIDTAKHSPQFTHQKEVVGIVIQQLNNLPASKAGLTI